MALIQAASPLDSTQVALNILPYWLSRFVRLLNREPKVGLQIIWGNTEGIGQNSFVHQFNERSPLTGVAIVPENDAAPEAVATLSSGTITGDRRGLRTFVIDAANQQSIENENTTNAAQLFEAFDQYWHGQTLALFTGITATSGDSATVNTLENWDLVTASFRTDNHDNVGSKWAVMNPDAIRDLRTDLRTNAASLFGTPMVEAEARAVLNTRPGLGVAFDGYVLYESGDTPVGDVTGWTNALGLLAGERSGLEMDLYEISSLRIQRDEGRFGQWQVLGGIAEVGIRTQGALRKFVTQT